MSRPGKIAIALVAALVAAAGCSRVSSQETSTVTIVYFNDLGGRVRPGERGLGGLARIASELKKLRSDNPNLILLVSGDLITGSPLSSLTKGEALFRLANRMDIQAFAPGNHEFDYGVAQYEKFMKIAEFPFVAANMFRDGDKPLADAPFLIIHAGNVKVGVIGAITPDTPWLTFPENTLGVSFENAAWALNRTVPEVDREAQMVVALTHLGLDEDRKLASDTAGIDLIVGGHSHDALKRPERVKNTWIVQAGEDGRYLGVVEARIDVQSEKIVKLEGRLIPMGPGAGEDPGMAAAVDAEEAALPIKLDMPLGTISRHLDRDKDLAPWIAGLMKIYTNADIGIVNKGGVRADLKSGIVTYRDIFRVMPFDNKVVLARIPGSDIRKWLERGAIILDRPLRINPNRIYTAGTMDFVAKIYHMPPKNIVYADALVRDLMIEDLKRRKSMP